jgi:hypothetical protein
VQAELAAQLLADGAVSGKAAVVLSMRGALAVDDIKRDARAVLVAWEHGNNGDSGPIPAVVEAVYGQWSPAGRLPFTMYPASFIEEANFFEMSMTKPPGRSYRYYQGAPLWPFGWGLSYAPFTLALASANSSTSLPVRLVAHVTNTFDADADEVVQLYFAPKWSRSSAPLPRKQLIDFARVHVTAGEAASLSFVVTEAMLRTVDAAGARSFVPGEYELTLTNGAANTVTHEINLAE